MLQARLPLWLLERFIHNADARLLDRYIQSSKMLHTAFLLLMLEAVTTDLVSPQPEFHNNAQPITPSKDLQRQQRKNQVTP